MSEELAALVQREELLSVEVFLFEEEDTARRVYFALLRDDVPVPLKSAVALFRTGVDFGVALLIGRSYRIPELPKPLDAEWSWGEYLERVGLPRQSEWRGWPSKTFPGFHRVFQGVTIVDYFLSPGLKGAGYRCLACGQSFAQYDELFDKHVYNLGGHDAAFNAAVLARLPQEQVAEGETPEAALDSALKALPAGAQVVDTSALRGKPRRIVAIGNSFESKERASEQAHRELPPGARIVREFVSHHGWAEETTLLLDMFYLPPDRPSMLALIRKRLGSSTIHDTPMRLVEIVDFNLARPGTRGFLGFGHKPAEYRVTLRAAWVAGVEYLTGPPATARVRYRLAGAEQPGKAA